VALAEEWDKKYQVLKAYVEHTGSPTLQTKQVVERIHLARWVENQKKYYRHGTLTQSRREGLEAIPGWEW